jgi:hypothetical protein
VSHSRGNSQGGDADCKSAAFAQVSSILTPRTKHPWYTWAMGRKKIDMGWDEQPLGRVSDRVLARELGVSQATVRARRTERGIGPACDRPRKTGIDWDSVALGRFPDRVIARKLGCGKNAVAYQRRKRGIPTFREACLERQYAYGDPMEGWVEE